MAAETQYTFNTGMARISIANSNLDGTGTLGTVLTAAANGTFIKTVTVKAQTNTTQGMVRLFIYDGTNTKLISEIEIPAVVKSATDPTFETRIPLNITLKAGYVLKASTENAETFIVIAEAQDWVYYTTSVRSDTTKYRIYNSAVGISAANSNLDGTGTLAIALVSGGCNLQSITIKAKLDTSSGMVRLFFYDGTNTMLFTEIPISAVTRSAIAQSFYHKIVFENGFAIKSGWKLEASTEKGESFNVITEALNLVAYPA